LIEGTISVSSEPARSASLTESLATLPISCAATCAAFGELADFGGDDRETLAVFAGARGFDGRVQGQQIGLVGDVVDDADLVGNALHRLDGLGDGVAAFDGLPGSAEAMPSVTLAFSVFCRIEALICSMLEVVSSTEAACSDDDCDSDCAVAEIWPEAFERLSAAVLTSPMVSTSLATVWLMAFFNSSKSPW
jgi:hypothetical protein